MDDGSEVMGEWSQELLEAEAKRLESEPNVDFALYLYPYANVGHAHDRWGLGCWDFCPASYVRFNKEPSLHIARAAIDAAEWIRLKHPQWALDGTSPTPRMERLIKLALGFWQQQKIEQIEKMREEMKINVKK